MMARIIRSRGGLTDLTGTTWTFNNEIDYTINTEPVSNPLGLSFTYDSYNFIAIADGVSRGTMFVSFEDDIGSSLMYNGNWLTAEPPTITITGGTDATNATLIAWFQANATQIS